MDIKKPRMTPFPPAHRQSVSTNHENRTNAEPYSTRLLWSAFDRHSPASYRKD